MHFKGVQEFKEDIVLSLLASLNIRVLLGVVGLLDVVKVENSASVFVHDAKGFLANVFSEFVHFTSDTSEEFFVVNSARSVSVEDSEESLAVRLLETNSEVSDGLLEFVHVKIL